MESRTSSSSEVPGPSMELSIRLNQADLPRPSQINPPSSSEIEPPRPSQNKPARPSQIEPPKPSQIDPPRPSQIEPPRPSQIEPPRPSQIEPARRSQIDPPRSSQANPSSLSQGDQRPTGGVKTFVQQGSMHSTNTNSAKPNQSPANSDQRSSIQTPRAPLSRNDDVIARQESRGAGQGLSPRGIAFGEEESSEGEEVAPTARLPSRQLAWGVERVGAKLRSEGQELRRRPGYQTIKQRAGDLTAGVTRGADLTDGRDELSEEGSSENVTVRWAKRVKYRVSLAWTRLRQETWEALIAWSPWSGQLKIVEGKFGSGVTSYFLFLRDLLFLNLIVFLLTLAFVIVPQSVYRWQQQVPPGYERPVNQSGPAFRGWNLIIGQGWFDNTELLYGYYTPDVINVTGASYDMKFAYICTAGGYYLLTLVILGVILSSSVQQSYLGAKKSVSASEGGRVFCAWNYSVTHRDAARLNHRAIYTTMMELLSAAKREKVKRSDREWALLIGRRVLINVVILGSIVGSGFLVWDVSDNLAEKNWRCNATAAAADANACGERGVWASLAMPLTVSAINFVLPAIFAFLVTLEQYENVRLDVYLNMGRTVLLALGTLAVLTSFWFSDCANSTGGAGGTDCVRPPCWESLMGSELYTMVVVDFVFILLATFLLEFIRKIVANLICSWLRKGHYLNQYLCVPEFDIGRNTLSLVYSQLLVWLGMFYCPFLSLVMVIKLFIIFYVKRVSVVRNCAPPAKAWRVGYTTTFLLFLVFLSFLLSVAGVAYGLAIAECSETCGPFQRYNYTYEIFSELGQTRTRGSAAAWIIGVITSIGFGAFIVILLGVVAFYSFVIASGHRQIARSLQKQLLQRDEERRFLLSVLQEANEFSMKRQQSRGVLAGQISVLLTSGSTHQLTNLLSTDEQRGASVTGSPALDSRSKRSSLTQNQPSSVKGSTQSQSFSTLTRPTAVRGSSQSQTISIAARPTSVQSRQTSVVIMEAINPAFTSKQDA